MKQLLLILLLFILLSYPESGYGKVMRNNGDKVKIDSITIKKNWRTKESIVLDELEIRPGDSVNQDQLKAAVSRIWNIGNFARVNYHIDTLKDERILLIVNAQDALTIMPIFSLTGNKEEYKLVVGVRDNNFLGRNINLGIAGGFGTNVKYADINVGIPRQLLFKNMTLDAGFMLGELRNYNYVDDKKVSGIAYIQRRFSFVAGNPYHKDYHYVFSPDLGISYLNQVTDSALLESGVESLGDYHASYIGFSANESVGMINQVRHQRNGYLVSGGVSAGAGLNQESPAYYTLGINFTYAKLLNKVVELDGNFSTNYTSSNLPSLINYLGPNHVKGILTGERSGKSLYSANASVNLTYVNRDWFAVEQSFFINFGHATNKYLDLYTTSPLYSVGSRVKILMPMIPWMTVSFYYAYRGNGEHWYSLDL